MIPKNRNTVARFARDRLLCIDGSGTFEVTSDCGHVFVTYREWVDGEDDERRCRVVRSWGQHLVVFLYEPSPLRDQDSLSLLDQSSLFRSLAWLGKEGSAEDRIVPFEVTYKPLTGRGRDHVGYDRQVARLLVEQGARSFQGRGWQKQMGEAMADLAIAWQSPWSSRHDESTKTMETR